VRRVSEVFEVRVRLHECEPKCQLDDLMTAATAAAVAAVLVMLLFLLVPLQQ
jgi:hypothetical protein